MIYIGPLESIRILGTCDGDFYHKAPSFGRISMASRALSIARTKGCNSTTAPYAGKANLFDSDECSLSQQGYPNGNR